MLLDKFLISPPFGNYLNLDWATSIAGSFTATRRTGLVWNTVKSLRRYDGGWINKIGLRNPGIMNIDFNYDKIYSIAALEPEDYTVFQYYVPKDIRIEINLGCPNVESEPVLVDFRPFVKKHPLVIAKLPPNAMSLKYADHCYACGIRYFHTCNTWPTDRGGVSGKWLRESSLVLTRIINHRYPDVTVIGGGGIYEPKDMLMYQQAGADHFSLSTVWFTPWKVRKLRSSEVY